MIRAWREFKKKKEVNAMKKENVNVAELITTALWIAVVTVVTISVVIPIPLTQGYVNLGDSVVFLGVFLLGRKNGTIAAGIGSLLADLLVGYTAFAFFTLIIKAAMAFIFGTFLLFSAGKIDASSKKMPFSRIMGVALATLVMSAGYYFAEWMITGNKVAPVVSIPWNILQGAIGGGLALLLMVALGSIRMPNSRKKDEVKSDVAAVDAVQTDVPQQIEEVEAEIVDLAEVPFEKGETHEF